MPGTRIGAKKFAKRMKAQHGKNYFKELGSKGGKLSTGGGFTGDSDRARIEGAKGGRPAQYRVQAHRAAVSKVRRDQALRWMAEGKRRIDPVTRLLVSVTPVAKITDDPQVSHFNPPEHNRQT